MSSITAAVLAFVPKQQGRYSNRLLHIHSCISIDRYGRLDALVEHKPWIAAIHRLLRAELRPDPRPKPNRPVQDKHWNQADLAVAAQIEGNTLSSILLGRRVPSTDTLCKIAKTLGVNPAVLWLTADEAVALENYHQHRATAAQAASMEDTIARIVERRAEEQKQAYKEREIEAVRAEVQHAAELLKSAPAARRSGGKTR